MSKSDQLTRRKITSKERLLRGVALGTLTVLGATGLAGCGPSGAGAEKSPTVATSSATPGETPSTSETATSTPSPESTLGTIENANLTSVFESPEFKALNPDQQARMKYIDAIDFTSQEAISQANFSPEEIANYVDLYFNVYGNYSLAMLKDAWIKDNEGTPAQVDSYFARYNKYRESYGPDMDGTLLEFGHQTDLALLAYSMTKGGDTAVVEAKRRTAVNVAIMLDTYSKQPGGLLYVDQSESLVNRLQTITDVNNSTNSFRILGSPKTSETIRSTNEISKDRIYKLTNISHNNIPQTQYYNYITSPEGNGYWKHYLSANQDEPLFIPDAKLADTAALQKVNLG